MGILNGFPRLHHPLLREASPQCTVASGDGCTVPEVLAYAAWQGAFVDREKMREIFYQAGDCRDGERCLIDVDELRGLLDRSFGAEVDEEDCEAMLWAADADYDGRVSFEEFMFADLWARTPDEQIHARLCHSRVRTPYRDRELINRGVVGRMVEDALEQTAKSKSR